MNELATRPRNTDTGFILVAVLLLIALVTILVVTTSFLARIERRSVGNSSKTELARQNALFGLNAALGQLQKDVGPDQAVTARADILDTNLTVGSTQGVTGVLNPYWTGAWKAYNPPANNPLPAAQNLDVDKDGNPDFGTKYLRNWSTAPVNGRPNAANPNMEWLVSGVAADHATAAASSGTPSIIATTWTPVVNSGGGSARNAVVLAKNLPDLTKAQPTTAVTNVAAPLVPIHSATATRATDPVLGQYAYWVSDEGIKAKANLLDKTLPAFGSLSYAQNQSHFLASQANLMTGLLPMAAGGDTRTDTAVPKVSTLQSLANLPSINSASYLGVGTGPTRFAPDVTTYSLGVLADVRNGGLKRDLTAAFEDDKSINPSGQFQALLNSSGTGQDAFAVYRSSNPALAVPIIAASPWQGSTVIDGLRWQSLFQYYNLYKTTDSLWKTKGGSASAPPGIPGSNIGFTALPPAPYSVLQRRYQYDDGGSGAFGIDPIVPVVLEARVDIGICSFVDPSSGLYRLRLRYYPTLVLYNPYGVQITNNLSNTYNFYTNFFTISGRWQCIFKVNGTGIAPFDGGTTNPSGYSLIQGSGYPLSLVPRVSDVTTFDPGEVKIFTLTSDVIRGTLGDPSTSNVCNIQNLVNNSMNMSADYAQTWDLPWGGTANSSDKVVVTVGNMQMTANVAYENCSSLNAWPDSNTVSNRVQSLNLPTVTPTGSWPGGGLAISSLTGNGYLLAGFNVRSKGIKRTTDTNYANYANVAPPFVGNCVTFSDVDGGNWREVYARAFKPYASVSDVQMDNPPDGQPRHTSWGDHSVGDGPVSATTSRIPLRDVPCQPMFSLGQFSHFGGWYYASSGNWENLYMPARSIGGSFASDFALNLNTGTNAGNLSGNQVAFDNSFMANQTLFDSFYFSTVPAAAQPGADLGKYVMLSSQLDAAIQNNTPLPNNRMKFYFKNGVAPTTSSPTRTLSAYETELRDLKKAATDLVVDGAFNVNSTSVNAWKALLSSLSGNSLRVWNFTSGSAYTYSASALVNPIPRFWNLTWQGLTDQPWEGMRTLSPDNGSGAAGGLTALAMHIVQQVKTRGPFLSMGDFLNRRLGAAKIPLNSMGALQEAIEECAVPSNSNKNINDVAISDGTTVTVSGNGAPPVNSATGIPGYLMQQDLVQAFAPVMSARSDTFVVRCYGESNNPKVRNSDGSPKIEARAWGEAVIQRLPEYVDQSDPALTGSNAYGTNLGDATPVFDRVTNPASPKPIVNDTNQYFGRRLKIVSFRWLNETDL